MYHLGESRRVACVRKMCGHAQHVGSPIRPFEIPPLPFFHRPSRLQPWCCRSLDGGSKAVIDTAPMGVPVQPATSPARPFLATSMAFRSKPERRMSSASNEATVHPPFPSSARTTSESGTTRMYRNSSTSISGVLYFAQYVPSSDVVSPPVSPEGFLFCCPLSRSLGRCFRRRAFGATSDRQDHPSPITHHHMSEQRAQHKTHTM